LLEKRQDIQSAYEKNIQAMEEEKDIKIKEIKEGLQAEKIVKLKTLAQQANLLIKEKKESLIAELVTERCVELRLDSIILLFLFLSLSLSLSLSRARALSRSVFLSSLLALPRGTII
jgi:hypothetical protein